MSSETHDVGFEPASGSPQPISNRDAFLRAKAELLANYFGKVVGFANGKLVGIADSFDSLEDQLEGRPDCLRVYVEFVDEAAFEEPEPVEILSAFETYPAGESA
jgi:hypothetical protein